MTKANAAAAQLRFMKRSLVRTKIADAPMHTGLCPQTANRERRSKPTRRINSWSDHHADLRGAALLNNQQPGKPHVGGGWNLDAGESGTPRLAGRGANHPSSWRINNRMSASSSASAARSFSI